MKLVIIKNKATKNLFDYAALVEKILRCAQDDNGWELTMTMGLRITMGVQDDSGAE